MTVKFATVSPVNMDIYENPHVNVNCCKSTYDVGLSNMGGKDKGHGVFSPRKFDEEY